MSSNNTQKPQPTVTDNSENIVQGQAKPKKKNRKKIVQPKNMVRKSTLYLSICFALLLGFYSGTVVQSFKDNGIENNAGKDNTATHIESLQAKLKNNPQDVNTLIHLGNVYFDANNPVEAIKAYEAALKINPNNPNVLTDLGTMYRKTQQFELALERYYSAQRLDPKHQNSFFNAGIVLYFDLGKKAEGKKMFEKVYSINPDAVAPNGKRLSDMLREM